MSRRLELDRGYWVRVLIGAGELLIVPFLPHADLAQRAVPALILGGIWLLWGGLLPLLSGSRAALLRLRVALAVLCDLAFVFTLHASVNADLNLHFGYIPAVVVHCYRSGLGVGSFSAAAAIVLSAVVGLLNPHADAVSSVHFETFAVTLLVLTVLLDVLGRQQRRATRSLSALKEKAEAVIARAGDAIVVTDTRGRIRQWNFAAEHVAGCPSDDAVGRGCTAMLGLHLGERALDCSTGCGLLAQSKDPETALDVEVWRSRGDGSRQPLLVSVSTVGEAGKDGELVHAARDITKLKEADEAKSMFLATASHELKTPLTVIRGFAHLLGTDAPHGNANTREGLQAIERRTIELGKVVERLLLSSQIETGMFKLDIVEANVGPILEERVTALRAAAGSDVHLWLEPELPSVRADPDAVTTVIDHLLDNAVKYSPDGGVIVVEARSTPDQVRLSVADRGLGMDLDQQERCFDRFWQADSTDTRRFSGTGIGLFIVRSLVEGMNGEVRVSSALEHGSTFSVLLPRAEAPDGADSARDEAPIRPGVGDRSIVREFMRQIGVPSGTSGEGDR